MHGMMDMDHGHDHGDMDMGDGQCSMNVSVLLLLSWCEYKRCWEVELAIVCYNVLPS